VVQVREAVQKAQTYLPDIFPTAEGKQMRLEGVVLSDDAKFWTVTFSYELTQGEQMIRSLNDLSPREYSHREYKTVKLRAEDGEFVGASNGLSSSSLM
jgi:hypothetical protein